jgi:hypothetical protein
MNRKIQPAEIYFAFFSFEGSESSRENENYFYSLQRRDSKALFLVFVYVSSLLFSLKLSRF